MSPETPTGSEDDDNDDAGLLPGFADPVQGTQRSFRAILDAMARPGRIHACGGELATPRPLGPAMAAVCLTLADADTPLWLSPSLATRPVCSYLRFHCHSPLTEQLDQASFVLAAPGEFPDLSALATGVDRFPDRGATTIAEVASLVADAPGGWTLTGPGIDGAARLEVAGLPAEFPRVWRCNGARFPRGVDLILTSGDRLAALPRTTRVEE
jgi:alpha-D-ribose 1-methylphosphonate 5-triphosphate synthase subunit PhnH